MDATFVIRWKVAIVLFHVHAHCVIAPVCDDDALFRTFIAARTVVVLSKTSYRSNHHSHSLIQTPK